MMRTKKPYEISSGNVFADLGLPHPEERLASALSVLAERAQNAPDKILPLSDLLTANWTEREPIADYWTDDRAPVEWITDRMIVSYGFSGQDRYEQLLPTAP